MLTTRTPILVLLSIGDAGARSGRCNRHGRNPRPPSPSFASHTEKKGVSLCACLAKAEEKSRLCTGLFGGDGALVFFCCASSWLRLVMLWDAAAAAAAVAGLVWCYGVVQER